MAVALATNLVTKHSVSEDDAQVNGDSFTIVSFSVTIVRFDVNVEERYARREVWERIGLNMVGYQVVYQIEIVVASEHTSASGTSRSVDPYVV